MHTYKAIVLLSRMGAPSCSFLSLTVDKENMETELMRLLDNSSLSHSPDQCLSAFAVLVTYLYGLQRSLLLPAAPLVCQA